VAPARKPDGFADMAVAKRAAGMGAVAVHQESWKRLGNFRRTGRKSTRRGCFVKARCKRDRRALLRYDARTQQREQDAHGAHDHGGGDG
jgi:hypothetical protein